MSDSAPANSPPSEADRRNTLREEAVELLNIAVRGAQAAQSENRRLGIPNTYAHRGTLYFELPSGEVTLEDPFAQEASADDAATGSDGSVSPSEGRAPSG